MKADYNRKILIWWGILFIMVFLYHMRFNVIPTSDDGWFAMVKEQYPLGDYLSMRYNTWSARIFPETMLYFIFHIPISLWRLLNTAFIFLLTTSIVRIVKVNVALQDVVLVLLLLGYSSFEVINSGFFWMTGSVNYLWPLALASYILIPFADDFFRGREITFSWRQLPRVILTSILAISNEQILACVIGVMVAYFINLFVRKKVPSVYLAILLLILIIGGGIMIFAPGNALRFESEIPRWYPDFNKLTFLGHMKVGVFWLTEQITTHFKVYMLIISLLTVSLLESMYLRRIFYIIGVIAFSLTVIKPALLSDFNRLKTVPFNCFFSSGAWYSRDLIVGAFPYVFWSLVFIYMVVCSCLVTNKPIFTMCCYLAGVCSCMIMFFSPTIFASGPRVFNCLVLFFVLINFMLYQKYLEQKQVSHCYTLFLLSIFPLLSFILS